MKLIKYTAAAIALASCAPNYNLYNVTHVIAESDSTIDVWASHAFIRTDIKLTSDSIYFYEALGPFGELIQTETIDYTHVLDVTDSTLTIQQPDQVTTYLLHEL
jgi:hypothetical protein